MSDLQPYGATIPTNLPRFCKSSSQKDGDVTVCVRWCYIAVTCTLIWRGGVDSVMVHNFVASFGWRGLILLFLLALLILKTTGALQLALFLLPMPASVHRRTGSLLSNA